VSPGRRRRGGAGAPGRQARPADAAVPAPPPPFDPASVEPVAEFAGLGLRAFTTTRTTGTYRLDGTDAVGDVVPRWHGLQTGLGVSRLASARQVHGAEVLLHAGGWRGWLRYDGADGHVTTVPRTALAVSVADCVPVFLAHPGGAVGLLHAGWRGTVDGIMARGLASLAAWQVPLDEVHVHLGPAICGRCYEVGPDVYHRLTGGRVSRPALVDLRAVLARQAGAAGVRHLSVSPRCTRCDNDRFWSHRAGDAGRQLGVIVSGSPSRP
jgi:YfiH family protein